MLVKVASDKSKDLNIKIGDTVRIDSSFYLITKTAGDKFEARNYNGVSGAVGALDSLEDLSNSLSEHFPIVYSQEEYEINIVEKSNNC